MNKQAEPFSDYLHQGIAKGGFETDDVLAGVLPLMNQVAETHRTGNVAPLEGVANLRVDHNHIYYVIDDAMPPRKNIKAINRLQSMESRAVEIVGHHRLDLDGGSLSYQHRDIEADGSLVPERLVYAVGYVCWEHLVAHHDELTDIFSLGMLLGSVSCGIDFTDNEGLKAFVENRDNLFRLNERLHPVLASVIARMTELNRHCRAQDLASIIHHLENYRDQPIDYSLDFSQFDGFKQSGSMERREIILKNLRNRLFELSKRNRLIHFKTTLQTLNLTVASVPLLLDVRNIKPEAPLLLAS